MRPYAIGYPGTHPTFNKDENQTSNSIQIFQNELAHSYYIMTCLGFTPLITLCTNYATVIHSYSTQTNKQLPPKTGETVATVTIVCQAAEQASLQQCRCQVNADFCPAQNIERAVT